MSSQTSLIEVSKKKKLVVFGGNGYVGQGVVEEALREGVDVISINRSGPPINFKPPVEATGQVTWLKGDVFEPSNWKEEIKGAAGVVSCIGAFGSNRFMEKINGDANIVAIKEAKDADIPRFVFVSTVENNLPEFFLRGYFNGKRRAEKELIENYGINGAVLRPGFIYGTRNLQIPEGVFSNILGKTLGFPLWAIGKPLEQVFSTNPVKLARDKVPGMKACLAAPISRDAVAKTAVSIALGSVSLSKNVLAIEDINSIAGNSKQQ